MAKRLDDMLDSRGNVKKANCHEPANDMLRINAKRAASRARKAINSVGNRIHVKPMARGEGKGSESMCSVWETNFGTLPAQSYCFRCM